MEIQGPIGVFDSGFGGLTVLKAIREKLPEYDYLYLGDNARTPYGTRSFETVYRYTWQAVQYLFDQGCPLVILACNTASAKALRNIQQLDLPSTAPEKRVLGVIRPTTEIVGNLSASGQIGILGTNGTVQSKSYPVEIEKFFPELKVFQQACPLWVPLVENGELTGEGPSFFVSKYLDQLLTQSINIDTILLACTHYPLLLDLIEAHLPEHVKVVSQGEIVAESLKGYLRRHPEMAIRCLKKGNTIYQTTDSTKKFERMSNIFLGEKVVAEQVNL